MIRPRRPHLSFFVSLLALATLGVSRLQAQIETAEELFVSLDASDPSAGTDVWTNEGSLDDFSKTGDPIVETIDGATAVTFNRGATLDAYQCLTDTPGGLVGIDPTRSIEAWVYNPSIPMEDTVLAWGKRGGPAGTNMSFNYGSSQAFGAIGHWDAPDIGWGTVPIADAWHHLAYTFDGTTTRVYADGVETAMEVLAAGTINTDAFGRITLAAQIEADGITLNMGLRGTLSIGRVRIHDGVLTAEQILNNYNLERPEFPLVEKLPVFVNAPAADSLIRSNSSYAAVLYVRSSPAATVEALEPAGATFQNNTYTYNLPSPPPASFNVKVRATNTGGSAEATWTVTLRDPPAAGALLGAGELFVSLDAADASAGTETWTNQGTIGDFARVGLPTVVDRVGTKAVQFNAGADLDSYQCVEDTPAGLVGPDPTRSIETWVYNEGADVQEETILAWGMRGGGPGTNMSFNLGTHGTYGAVGHWDAPDLGWNLFPSAGQWHHLVYTYDGAVTHVYDNGKETAFEVLGTGVINTHAQGNITLVAQLDTAGDGPDTAINLGLRGTMAIGRVRIHDGVLSPYQVQNNFLAERGEFPLAIAAPAFVDVPGNTCTFRDAATYRTAILVSGFPQPDMEVLEPAGATVVEENSPPSAFRYVVSYNLPNPKPATFTVHLRATNRVGSSEATWTLTLVERPPTRLVESAGELFVDLSAADLSAGAAVWDNKGTIGDFARIGLPFVEFIDCAPAVTFNKTGVLDAYQCDSSTPGGLVGRAATRSIEAWAYNPVILAEETIVAWGKRGGPNGSNMSFNFGTHGLYGAIGHWGGDGPDIGWGTNPTPAEWHHLVYTYDGDTTRVYVDGVETNNEQIFDIVDTYPDPKITIAAQLEPDGVTLNTALRGQLSIGKLRIHDDVLEPDQIAQNYATEVADFVPFRLRYAPSDEDAFCEMPYVAAVRASRPATYTLSKGPAGATIDGEGNLTYSFTEGAGATVEFEVTATSGAESLKAGWKVKIVNSVRHEFVDAAEVDNFDFSAGDGTARLLPEVTATVADDTLRIHMPGGSNPSFDQWCGFDRTPRWLHKLHAFQTFDVETRVKFDFLLFPTTDEYHVGLAIDRGLQELTQFGLIRQDVQHERNCAKDPTSPVFYQDLFTSFDDRAITLRIEKRGLQERFLARLDEEPEFTEIQALNNVKPTPIGVGLATKSWGNQGEFVASFDYFQYGNPGGECRTGGGGNKFIRGDCNGDGQINGVGDAIFQLTLNFIGGVTPKCRAACDANADGVLTGVGDAILNLTRNFIGGVVMTPPFPGCGTSTRPQDETLGCEQATCQ